jgi:hypothetical protein
MWDALRDDESADRSALSREIRRDFVHVFTAMKYVSATRTASFWSRTDVIQKMKDDGGWEAFIWRVDTWRRVTEGVKVKDGVIMKGPWSQ